MTHDAKALVSLCEIFASFSSVLGFVAPETKRASRGPSAWGASDYGTQRPRAGAQSPDPTVGQLIGWRQGLEIAARKKLRKEAVKPMKSLACVNLCARGSAKEP